jgi:hypothetical protein
MLDSVIRYLSIKVDENIQVDARPSEIDDTSFDKAAQTAADEEDLFLSRGSDESSGDGDDDDEDEYRDFTQDESFKNRNKESDKAPAADAAPAPAAPATEDKE